MKNTFEKESILVNYVRDKCILNPFEQSSYLKKKNEIRTNLFGTVENYGIGNY
jgi:hypothetical protein